PDGTKKWEFATGDYVISSPAIGADGTIYFGSDDNKFYALNPDGTKKWEFPMASITWETSPAIGTDGTVYIPSAQESKIYALASSSMGLADSPWPRFGQNNRGTSHQKSVDNSLVAHFPFNGSAEDISGYENNGTVRGATLVADRNGTANSSYAFDGTDDDILIGDTGFPMGNSARTIAGWARIDTNATGDNTLLFYGSPTEGMGFKLDANGHGNLEASVPGEGNGTFELEANRNIRDGQWYHVAFSYDGNGTARLYIDATLEANATNWVMNTSARADGDYNVIVTNGAGESISSGLATVTVVYPPTITAQPGPTDRNATSGSSTSYTVVAGGTAPFTYLWQKDNNGTFTDLNATSATLNLTNLQLEDNGTYRVVATNPFGAATSNPVHLTVGDAPVIAAHPQNVVAATGASVKFEVQASGPGPLSYLWFKDGTPIADTNASHYMISNVPTDGNATYRVKVSNIHGETISADASLAVTQPVVVIREAFLHRQHVQFQNHTDQNASSLSLGSFQAFAELRASVPSKVSKAWLSYDHNGSRHEFDLHQRQFPPLWGGWYDDDEVFDLEPGPMAYGTDAELDAVWLGNTWDFNATWTNPAHTANWSLQVPRATDFPPAPLFNLTGETFRTQGINRFTLNTSKGNLRKAGTANVPSSSVTSFLTDADPVNPQRDVSRYEDYELMGVTNGASVTLDHISQQFDCWLQVIDANGSLITENDDGGVGMNSRITLNWQSGYRVRVTSWEGLPKAYLNKNAAQSWTVKWAPFTEAKLEDRVIFGIYSDSADSDEIHVVLDANATSYTIPSNTLSPNEHYGVGVFFMRVVDISNAPGVGRDTNGSEPKLPLIYSHASRATGLRISTGSAPVITSHPEDINATAGNNVTFDVNATGIAPLTYQWQKNGADLPGANSATLQLTDINTTHAGTYRIIVSNDLGSVTSNPVHLTVGDAPVIATHPTDANATTGTTVSFDVNATGTEPLSYQWQKNGVDINGSTSATLTLNNVQGEDNGTYTVVVSNSLTSTTSNPATLTVRLPANLGEFNNGLIAYYPFNGNANDESGHDNNG
ncbi:MAG: immunoglobulin domain-containing protein, partial [Verrucomicrobiota bacterium]|nr:immunoglobulin domain-containing protein [Verrucomicrobiota bacterium]